jgi:hypothetical protein
MLNQTGLRYTRERFTVVQRLADFLRTKFRTMFYCRVAGLTFDGQGLLHMRSLPPEVFWDQYLWAGKGLIGQLGYRILWYTGRGLCPKWIVTAIGKLCFRWEPTLMIIFCISGIWPYSPSAKGSYEDAQVKSNLISTLRSFYPTH